jgi:glutaredoxin-like protein
LSRVLDEKTRNDVRKMFGLMKNPVRIMLFEDYSNGFSQFAKQILTEVSELNDNIKLSVYNSSDPLFSIHKVEKTPCVMLKSNGMNFKYYGSPSGYQFQPMVENIIDVSFNFTHLNEKVKNKVLKIKKPTSIKLFVTPTCPYSPLMVRSAFKFAFTNSNIETTIIETNEFEDMIQKFKISNVPKVIIKGKKSISFEGAIPEEKFASYLLKANNQR